MGVTLVTGGSGFIGSHLVAALAERGERVRILDIALPYAPLPGVAFTQGSVLDRDAVGCAFEGVDRVFHLAAVSHLWQRDRTVFERVNQCGTRVVLEAAARAGVRRFVHCSTEAVLIGRTGSQPVDECTDPGLEAMAGPYCRSKYLAERDALAAAAEGMPVVVVNPTAPIGPGDRGPTPPTAMLRLFLRGGPSLILNCLLNLVHVRDVADGMILAAERGLVGERYILGGTDVQLSDLAARLDHLAGRQPRRRRAIPGAVALAAAMVDEWVSDRITHRPPRAPITGVRLALAARGVNNGKARHDLGYRARPLDEALGDAVAWLEQAEGSGT
ncbi:MAG TPA: NAD-dependent epimerase/dehydratase family protein [Azospirillum sp.]|nr:NAD-dependent epimerase/dehydratase family protein [Azospirillum sp.]